MLRNARSSLCPSFSCRVLGSCHPGMVLARNASRIVSKRLPARLLLSRKVAEQRKPREKRADSPPAALNQRHANIPAQFLARQKAPRPTDLARTKDANQKERPKAKFKHMKMAQSLASVSVATRTATRKQVQASNSFEEFDLLGSIRVAIAQDVLAGLSTIQPTPVQRLVIPTLLAERASRAPGSTQTASYLVAAETGSGKTLAYALPVVDQIKRTEEAEKELDAQTVYKPVDPFELEIPTLEQRERNGRPRAVVLVPTSELVEQVGALFKSLSHSVKFRAVLISRDYSAVVLRKRLFETPVDVVVATPHLLNSLTEKSPNTFSKCTQIVVDEADSLFDRSFSPITSALISRVPELQRLVLCSATIPRSLDNKLRESYPNLCRLTTPNLHAIPRRVQLSIVDVEAEPYQGQKKLACADMLHNIAKDGSEEGFVKKVIVFVNERQMAAELAEYLRSKSLDAIEFARDTAGRTSSAVLELFTGAKEEADPSMGGKQRMKILVTTDIASRGVDTKTVKNVILYDVPYSTIDFIHRLGRTGRMGRRGRAVILVDKDTNKGWISDIKTSMHMGGPLV